MATLKTQKFINAYLGEANGNATKASIMAGYSERGAHATGSRLLRKVEVQRQIAALRQQAEAVMIATRAERQGFWTETMRQKAEATRDRLKASELLGRSERDFDDGVKVQVNVPTQVVFAIKQSSGSDNQT